MAVDWPGEAITSPSTASLPRRPAKRWQDPDAIVFDPDYNSHNGEGVRTIGFSPSAASILTVITYVIDGVTHGASAWKSNGRDCRYYRQGGPNE